MSNVILFLCVANSARSQMAEGLARAMNVDGLEVHSAGSNPAVMNPFAARVLAERGIDSNRQYSKGLADVPLSRVKTVITLCEEEVCPNLAETTKHLHWPVPDPAGVQGTDEEKLESFRVVCGSIEQRLREFFGSAERSSAIA